MSEASALESHTVLYYNHGIVISKASFFDNNYHSFLCQEGPPMVKLELYRVFREVAEAGNISLAAENL